MTEYLEDDEYLDDTKFCLPSHLFNDEDDDHHHFQINKIPRIRFDSCGTRGSETPLRSSSVDSMTDQRDDRENHLTGSNQPLIQQQLLEAHQFPQMKQYQQSLQHQQQLLKQRLSAALGLQGKVVPPALSQQQVQNTLVYAQPIVTASSFTWQPLLQQQGSFRIRESFGTGVFIPRSRSFPAAETLKNPAGCPSNGHVKCSSSTFQQIRTATDGVTFSGQQQYVESYEICPPKEWA